MEKIVDKLNELWDDFIDWVTELWD